MEYLLAFLEGVITFISPCVLPMLPLYAAYFAAGEQGGTRRTLYNSLGFVLGFTIIFTLLGIFAATLGGLLVRNQSAVNMVTGSIVVLLGLCFLGVLRLPFLGMGGKLDLVSKYLHSLRFASSVLFGMVFAVGWTPCVGAFLGSALMMAASSANRTAGAAMLLLYSAGLGIPFVLSALFIERLKGAFTLLKKHHGAITALSGVFLILLGISIIAGMWSW